MLNSIIRRLSLTALATAWCFTFSTPAMSEKPNVIIIYTDDQGYGDASCLNPNAKFRTPNLDRLAAEGISFTNAHSSDTVCTPSRYGLLTGRYCWRTIKKTGVFNAEVKCLIDDRRTTIASMLRQNGYDTAMVGKWHLGMDFPGTPQDRDWSQPVQDMPLDKGFGYFYGIPASLNYGILAWFDGRHAKVPPTLFTNKKPNKRHLDYRIMPPYQATPAETQKAIGKNGFEIAPDFVDNQCLTRFTDKAIQWMETKKKSAASGKPFFLYLPYTSPHYPVCPLEEFWGQGAAGGYGEFMIETDHHVGRILDFLKSSGLDDNTMVIYTSDNGPEKSWSNRLKEFQHDSRGGFRGGKRDIYEGGHRVPFFVRWPNKISKPGRSFNGLVGQVDILATLAELTGHSVDESTGEDSQSFLNVLIDSDSTRKRLPLINHGSSGRFSITEDNWKLILPHKKAKTELYDLSKDPSESKNVLADNEEIAKSLKQKLTDIVCRGRTTKGAVQTNDTQHWNDLTWMTEAYYAEHHGN